MRSPPECDVWIGRAPDIEARWTIQHPRAGIRLAEHEEDFVSPLEVLASEPKVLGDDSFAALDG